MTVTYEYDALKFSLARGALRIATGNGTSMTNSLLMHSITWDIPDLIPLWVPGDVRGNDVVIPGAAGVLPYRRRQTVTGYSLPLIVTGRVDMDGQPTYDDPWSQLELNLAFLTAAVVDEPGTVAGTRMATLTMPSGDVRSADIHVLGITPGRVVDGIMLATFDISIPAGKFA